MNPTTHCSVSPRMQPPAGLTKAQYEHLLLCVAAGGTYVIRGGPLYVGPWNRGCANLLAKRKLLVLTPGREGAPPTATITAAGLAMLGIREAA